MRSAHDTERETYRLIVTRRNVSEILPSGGSGSSLPRVEVLRRHRIAEQLTAGLYAQCGCRAYCLLVPALAGGLPPCAIMEVPDPGDVASAGTGWKLLDAAAYAAIESAEDRLIIEKSLEELDAHRRNPNRSPFARPGWLEELFAWVQQRLGLRSTRAYRQLNASPTFSLIRLETNDSAVWFKATGEPNRHELAVTTCLARLFPGYVPELLGVHGAWNGWLAREASGRTLSDRTELSVWLKAAEDLARLQILSIGKQTELLEGSCRDWRVRRLSEAIDPFVDRMRGLMSAQDKETPARLTDMELTFLRDGLKQACSQLSEINLPDTLGHLDFNPGNIVISTERSVFLDWAEGCVTNPLITFEYLREHFRRNCTNDVQTMDALVAAYTHPWRNSFSPDAFDRAMVLSPLVAVLAYSVASPAWRSPEVLRDPSVAGYFRSFTRRMYREITQIAERRKPCLA